MGWKTFFVCASYPINFQHFFFALRTYRSSENNQQKVQKVARWRNNLIKTMNFEFHAWGLYVPNSWIPSACWVTGLSGKKICLRRSSMSTGRKARCSSHWINPENTKTCDTEFVGIPSIPAEFLEFQSDNLKRNVQHRGAHSHMQPWRYGRIAGPELQKTSWRPVQWAVHVASLGRRE